MGRRGGRARAKRLSAERRRQIASLGGRARHRSRLVAQRIVDNLRYVAAVLELRGGPRKVPMLMLLGYSPELTQAAYRIGDSVANVVTPLMSYFVVIVTFVQRYEPRAGIGTVVALMLPYSIAFYLAWVGLLVVWMGFGWPLGPGAPLFVPVG